MFKRFNPQGLIDRAQHLLQNAHAPFSQYRAVAVIRLDDGQVFCGVTVDNAAFVHGYEALEAALGAMIAQSGWAQKAALPVITDIVFLVDAPSPQLPAPQGMSVLSLFAALRARLHLATATQGLHKTILVARALQPLGAPVLDRDAFLKLSAQRLQEPHKITDPAMAKLLNVRWQAFCPVSEYAVGAVIETTQGNVYYGCNLELGNNRALHAEGVAIAQMVTAEGPAARIRCVVILTKGKVGFPCGGCRQNIQEFATPETEVIGYNLDGQMCHALHRDLLPGSFGHEDIDSARVG